MAKPARSAGKKAAPTFVQAIEMAEHLELVRALGAVKRGEGRDRIHVSDDALLGSVDIDGNCRATYPQAPRWDYVIGVRRSKAEVAIFVEVHSAETSEVSKMEDKLTWLQNFLRRDQQQGLAALPREIYWVASGRVNIPKHLPQYKKLQTKLREQGLRGPVTQLDLP